MAKKGGLGKGLDALFLDNTSGQSNNIIMLRLSQAEPNKEQPRRDFDEGPLQELADSIGEHGVLQPIIVRPLEDGRYQIIAGERRWRASRLAGLSEIPAIVKEVDDARTRELALIENLQRQDLNVLEEAEGYKALMDSCGLTQEQAAARVGKSRPVVANALRILTLPGKVIDLVRKGALTAGHARLLVGLPEGEANGLAAQIAGDGLSVRAAETLVRSHKAAPSAAKPAPKKPASWGGDSYNREVELALQESTGRRVKIAARGEGGRLEIEFFSREDLAQLASRLEEGFPKTTKQKKTTKVK